MTPEPSEMSIIVSCEWTWLTVTLKMAAIRNETTPRILFSFSVSRLRQKSEKRGRKNYFLYREREGRERETHSERAD